MRGAVRLSRAPFKIDDDHVPFLEQGIRTVHVIDWTNLEEWHKETDTPAIISYDKLAQLGDVLMKFLNSERNPSFAKKGF